MYFILLLFDTKMIHSINDASVSSPLFNSFDRLSPSQNDSSNPEKRFKILNKETEQKKLNLCFIIKYQTAYSAFKMIFKLVIKSLSKKYVVVFITCLFLQKNHLSAFSDCL